MIDLGSSQYRNAVASGSSDVDANPKLPRNGTDSTQAKILFL